MALYTSGTRVHVAPRRACTRRSHSSIHHRSIIILPKCKIMGAAVVYIGRPVCTGACLSKEVHVELWSQRAGLESNNGIWWAIVELCILFFERCFSGQIKVKYIVTILILFSLEILCWWSIGLNSLAGKRNIGYSCDHFRTRAYL